MTSTATTTRPVGSAVHNPVTAHLVRAYVPETIVLFGLYLVGVALVGIGVATFTTVSGIFWTHAIQIPLWYALVVGVYVTAVYLPLYVAHGRTRREVARGGVVFGVVHSALLGAMLALGYALEAAVYALLGWTSLLESPHPLGTPADALVTLAELSLTVGVFTAVGALCGAAFYRHGGLGVASLPFGLLALGGQGVLLDAESVGPLPIPEIFVSASPGVALPALVVLAAGVATLTWPIIRDIGVRSDNT